MLLEVGDTCWRKETADRFSVLVENDAYFAALADALPRARRSVMILGWQFDPRTRLDPADAGAGSEVGFLLRRLSRDRPELDVKLLIWRSPLPIAWSQDFFPQRTKRWFRPHLIDFRLDRPRPLGACHHQKVVVIDDEIAFCGGGDISVDRWDTDEHLDHDPRRCTPTGIICKPRHEVMALVSGPAARALGDLCRERWFRATGERLIPGTVEEDPWPQSVPVDLRDVAVGVARTEPAWRGRRHVRENERLHLRAIAEARRLIYLENQYVTSPLIAAALAARLQEPEGPEVVVVSTGASPSWFDQATMDSARRALIQRLRACDVFGRFSAWKALTAEDNPVIVHSKVTIVDDRFVRIGSTNLNNRSNGFDTECDLAVEDDRPETAAFVRNLRARLVGHFMGRSAADVERVRLHTGYLAAAIQALGGGGRRLAPLGTEPATRVARFMAEYQFGDPASPADSWRPWRRIRLSRLLRQKVREARAAQEAAFADSISKSTTSGR